MFSRPVRHVAQTRIFARPLDGGSQALVYSMNLEIEESLAMVLPLPVPPRPGDDAVRFVDLSAYPEFFRDLDRAFPVAISRSTTFFPAPQSARPKLEVHQVGDFEASFVPAQEDFERLDERFRLDASVWQQLPAYADHGFAVFKLAPRRQLLSFRRQTIHPMAFVFPRRDPRSLFFPTVHVHDGVVHEEATFDHQLYCQPDPVTAATFAWARSTDRLGLFVDAACASALVDADAPVYRTELRGSLPNIDIALVPPDIELDQLQPRRACYELGLRATAAYYANPQGRAASWRTFARSQLPTLSQRLVAAFDTLMQQRAQAWRLGWYDDRPLYTMSWLGQPDDGGGYFLVGPDTGFPFAPEYRPPTGPGRIGFPLRGDERIEPQHIIVAFEALPDSATLAEIQRELDGTFDATVRRCAPPS